jgi:RNA polymerase sigma-70 factor (ECF subfamily)
MSEKASGPEPQIVQSEQEEMVQMLLDELAPEYRQAVVLRYWYELSYDEIAEMMDTTVSAIKSRLFRARRQLAEVGMAAGLHPEAESATIS